MPFLFVGPLYSRADFPENSFNTPALFGTYVLLKNLCFDCGMLIRLTHGMTLRNILFSTVIAIVSSKFLFNMLRHAPLKALFFDFPRECFSVINPGLEKMPFRYRLTE